MTGLIAVDIVAPNTQDHIVISITANVKVPPPTKTKMAPNAADRDQGSRHVTKLAGNQPSRNN